MRTNAESNSILFANCARWTTLFALLFGLIGCESRKTVYVLEYDVGPTTAGTATPGDVDSLVAKINDRLRGVGNARALNDRQIAVDVYGPIDDEELELVKQRIESRGELGFHLLAAANEPNDAATLELARNLPPDEKQVLRDGAVVAEWLPYNEGDVGLSVATDGRVVTRLAGDAREILLLCGKEDVTGADLLWVRRDTDPRGDATFNFALNEPGSVRMHKLCSDHMPNPQTGEMRYLAVVFDGKLLAAPSIVVPIAQQGQISGQALTVEQIDAMIAILQAGELPANLRKIREVPVSPSR